MSRRAKGKKPTQSKPPTDEDIARADKPCAPPIACGTLTAESASNVGGDLVAMRYEPPIERLGRRLVEAALVRLDHHDPDRAVALTNTYIALVTEDERARA